jgi:hypothetical protein
MKWSAEHLGNKLPPPDHWIRYFHPREERGKQIDLRKMLFATTA